MNPAILAAIKTIVPRVLDSVLPDKEKSDAAKLELARLEQTGELAYLSSETDLAKSQIEVNKIDAASEDKFTKRARPFAIWVGGVSLAYVGIIDPILKFVARVFLGYTGEFPEIDTVITFQILTGLLGLGGFRSYDKRGKK